MNLFYIRNVLGAKVAEAIILNKNIKNNYALLLQNKIPNYPDKIKKLLNNLLWEEIKVSNLDSSISIDFRNSKLFFNLLEEQSIEINKLLEGISAVYLSNLNSIEERLIFTLSRQKNVTVNFFEEGLNLYFDPPHEIPNLNFLIKFKGFFKFILARKYRYILKNKSTFKAQTIYCIFPEKYKFENYKYIEKVIPSFNILQGSDVNKKNNIKTLFISRPLSEDKILSLNEEIYHLENFIKTLNNDLIIKFHPRESEEKRAIILEKLNVFEISKDCLDLTAEEVILNSSIEVLIGYESSTLAYISELSNIKVYSLLKEINQKSFYLTQMTKFLELNFKRINFIELHNNIRG